jgi:hypothetical protein
MSENFRELNGIKGNDDINADVLNAMRIYQIKLENLDEMHLNKLVK